MWIMKGLSVLLFAIASIVVSIVAITSVAVFVTSPFVLLDREGRSMLGTILGYISTVSLSSIFMIVMLTIFLMECVNFYFERDLNVLGNIKRILLWISGTSGVFVILGFLAASLIPVIWWAHVDYKDVGMYTGSVLLSSSATGGVIGVLLGVTSAPYRIEFFNEDSLSENDGARLEKFLNAFGPGVIFLGVSCVFHVLGIDAVQNFYRFGNDLLVSEGVDDCDQSAGTDVSIAVACVTKGLAGSEATITYTYYAIIFVVMFVCAIYRYAKSGEVMRIVCGVRKFVSDLSKYKRSLRRSKHYH